MDTDTCTPVVPVEVVKKEEPTKNTELVPSEPPTIATVETKPKEKEQALENVPSVTPPEAISTAPVEPIKVEQPPAENTDSGMWLALFVFAIDFKSNANSILFSEKEPKPVTAEIKSETPVTQI